ncbi:MAG: ABC transporter substrate-binding protein [Gemmatimonadaceae bacterium]|nr:ABC transporter substrate-binding protein [Gemmatimonadaceae bacterium]
MEFLRILATGVLALSLATSLGAQPISVRDGAGLTVTLKAPAHRVAALLSSAVDIIVALGAADRIAARTRYDTASAVARAANVGGGIDPSVEALVASRPDLFVVWKGQAGSTVVSRMRALGVPVYLVETKDTSALFATVRDLGALLGMTPRATAAATQLRAELRAVQAHRARARRLRAVYVISRSPVIISAASSYMGELISVAGADNPFHDVSGEFPTLSLEAFVARDPDVLIVGHRDDGGRQLIHLRDTPGWRDLRAVRTGAVIEVDGEQWGRPTLRAGALVRDLAEKLQRVTAPARPVK